MSIRGIAQKSTRSAAWLYGQRILTYTIGLVSIAILSRKLDPADFGVVALTDVLMRFSIAYGQATVGNYIIFDREDGREERVQASFWLNMALVSATVLIFLAAMPFLVQFYEQPMLGSVLIFVLIRFFLSELSIVPDALIRRELDYHKLVIRDTVLQLLSAIIGISMALSGWGIWSLVIPGTVIALPRFILVTWMAHWHPTFPFRFSLWGRIFNYTKNIIGSNLLGELTSDGDTLIVGKLVGSEGLGIYDRAWTTANLVTSNIVWVVADIAMPSFSVLKSRLEVLRQAYQRLLRLLGIVSFPILIGMFVLAEEFVLTLYGPKWIGVIVPLRIFLIYTMQRAVGSPVGVVYNTMGRPDVGFKLNLVLVPFYFASIFLGSVYGVNGIAIGVTIVKTISGFVAIYLACYLLGVSYPKLLRYLWPPLEISLIMGVAVFVAKSIVAQFIPLPDFMALLIFTFFGVCIYLGLLLTRYTYLLNEFLVLVDSFSPAITKRLRPFLHRFNQAIVDKQVI